MDRIAEQPPEDPINIVLDDLEEIKNKMGSLVAKVDGLDDKVSTLDDKVSANCTKLNDLKTEVGKLTNSIDGHGDALHHIVKGLRQGGIEINLGDS